MGWASRYIERLRSEETVSFRPHGHSMTGRIDSGQLCCGYINGCIGPENIYGKCVKVES
jgi:hypothetical protein